MVICARAVPRRASSVRVPRRFRPYPQYSHLVPWQSLWLVSYAKQACFRVRLTSNAFASSAVPASPIMAGPGKVARSSTVRDCRR